MRKGTAFALILGVGVLASGCATSAEWAEWRAHPTHFASNQHLGFSVRHTGESPTPSVRRGDIDAAQKESWWGKAILVSPDQIFEN
ncbi:MAG TPA: hypothetical protein VJO34_10920 [Methylomirabilota bacterium]|nr:hypothetical protein [Methylomirabilota bacterium]